MKSFTESKNFCDYCQKTFDKFGDHSCSTTCKMCKHQGCIDEQNNNLKCSFCHKRGYNFCCLKFNEEKICYKRDICSKCNCIKKKNRHVCEDHIFVSIVNLV